MKRVLVTGGAGFIGSHLAKRLLTLGYAVEVVDNLSTGTRENIPDGVHLIEADLGRHDIEGLLKGEYFAVCHLAGQSSGEKSFDDPLYDWDANARSTLVLSEWARQRGVRRFLYASSMGVYGQPEALPVAEDTRPAPLSFYGHSKLAAERILTMQARLGLSCASIRMFSVYGPGQNLADLRQGMASIFLAYLLGGRPIVVKGSLDRVRDFIYIDDVVDGWIRLLESKFTGEVNLGSGSPTSVGHLLERLMDVTRKPGSISAAPGTPGDQHSVYADLNRLREVLHWVPRTSLEEGLTRFVQWATGESSAQNV